MRNFKLPVLIVLVSIQTLCFAQVSREEIYKDIYLKAFTNQVLQKVATNLRASSKANISERKIISNIAQCQRDVIASDAYLSNRLYQMQQSATAQDDAAVLSALKYLKSNRGKFYLIAGNPLLSEAERKKGLKMVTVDPIKEPNLMTKQEGEYLSNVAALVLRTGQFSDLQGEFLKREKCKRYNLNQLMPAK